MIFPRFQTRAQTVDSGYQALSFSGGVRPGLTVMSMMVQVAVRDLLYCKLLNTGCGNSLHSLAAYQIIKVVRIKQRVGVRKVGQPATVISCELDYRFGM